MWFIKYNIIFSFKGSLICAADISISRYFLFTIFKGMQTNKILLFLLLKLSNNLWYWQVWLKAFKSNYLPLAVIFQHPAFSLSLQIVLCSNVFASGRSLYSFIKKVIDDLNFFSDIWQLLICSLWLYKGLGLCSVNSLLPCGLDTYQKLRLWLSWLEH